MAITKNSQIDLNGNEMILDADGDTTITADTDDQIDFKVAGSDKVQINATGLGIGQVPTRDLSLHAGDASSVFAHFTNTDTGTTSSDGLLIGLGSSEDLVLNNQESSKNIIIENGGSERMRIDASGDILVGTTTINTGTLGTSNKFLEVAAGTASGSGTLVLSRNTSTNDVELGGVRFVNANNADDDGLDADGKLVAAVSARSVTSDSNAGDDSGADLIFYTKPESGNYAERMRINSSGNVGLGARLSVGTTTVGGGNTKIVATGGTDNYLQLVSNTGSGGISLGNAGANLLIYSHTGALGSESFTERMRINSAGVVCIGTTGAGSSGALNIVGSADNANVGAARIQTSDINGASDIGCTAMSVVKTVNNDTTSNIFIRFGINGYSGGSGQINANGSSQAAFGTFSDRRLKENITDLPSQLDKIKAMRPVEFDYIESEGGGHQLGFVAQEIEEIYPDMVGERPDGMKTLSTLGKWEARLVKAIQEQQAQIEALQSEINTLKGG